MRSSVLKPNPSAGNPGRWYSIHRNTVVVMARMAATITSSGKSTASSTCRILPRRGLALTASSRSLARRFTSSAGGRTVSSVVEREVDPAGCSGTAPASSGAPSCSWPADRRPLTLPASAGSPAFWAVLSLSTVASLSSTELQCLLLYEGTVDRSRLGIDTRCPDKVRALLCSHRRRGHPGPRVHRRCTPFSPAAGRRPSTRQIQSGRCSCAAKLAAVRG